MAVTDGVPPVSETEAVAGWALAVPMAATDGVEAVSVSDAAVG
jgi:hypothetical protein